VHFVSWKPNIKKHLFCDTGEYCSYLAARMGSKLQPTLQMAIECWLCCTAQKYDPPTGRKCLGERYYWMYRLQNSAPSGYWHNGLAGDAKEQETGPGKRRDRNVYFGWENQCQTINRNIPHWPMLLYSTKDGTRATHILTIITFTLYRQPNYWTIYLFMFTQIIWAF